MNEILKNIKERRSIRAFTDKKVPEAALAQIVEAAVWAPTATNSQSFQFFVLTEVDKIQELAAIVGKAMGREGYNFYKPTAFILSAGDKNNANSYADCSCAQQNMMLAAHSLSIGSIWINQLKECCDEPSVRAKLTEYGVPSDYVIWGSVGLGYAANEPAAPARNVAVKYI